MLFVYFIIQWECFAFRVCRDHRCHEQLLEESMICWSLFCPESIWFLELQKCSKSSYTFCEIQTWENRERRETFGRFWESENLEYGIFQLQKNTIFVPYICYALFLRKQRAWNGEHNWALLAILGDFLYQSPLVKGHLMACQPTPFPKRVIRIKSNILSSPRGQWVCVGVLQVWIAHPTSQYEQFAMLLHKK